MSKSEKLASFYRVTYSNEKGGFYVECCVAFVGSQAIGIGITYCIIGPVNKLTKIAKELKCQVYAYS